MDVDQPAVLEPRRRVVEAVVGRLLDQPDDEGQPLREGREPVAHRPRAVEPHRHLGHEVAQPVAGQRELGEDREVGAGDEGRGHRPLDPGQVGLDIREARVGLGQGDPHERSSGGGMVAPAPARAVARKRLMPR